MRRGASNVVDFEGCGFGDYRNSPVVKVLYSKCLPQSDKNLRCFDSRNGTQKVTHVDPNRADGRRIAQSNANGIHVITHEIFEANPVIHISAVIECHQTQMFIDW